MKGEEESSKKKRKRENTVNARITYHSPLKVFERLFNESSLEDTKSMVKAKMGLPGNSNIQLEQLRGGKSIVLEDEDDFRAFCVAIQENPLIDVRVTVLEGVSEDITERPRKKKKSKAERHKRALEEQNEAAANLSAAINRASTSMALEEQPASLVSRIREETVPATITASTPPHDSIRTETISATSKPPEPNRVASPQPANSAAVPMTLDQSFKSTSISEAGTAGLKKRKDSAEKKASDPTMPKNVPDPSVALSPASHEKASLILQRHREAIAERANKPRGKKLKSSTIEVTPQLTTDPDSGTPVQETTGDKATKQDKDKRRKKTKPDSDSLDQISAKVSDPVANDTGLVTTSHEIIDVEGPNSTPRDVFTKESTDEVIWLPRNPSKKLVPVIPRLKVGTYVSNSKKTGINPETTSKPPAQNLASSTAADNRESESGKPPKRTRPRCPICDAPFHLRSQCSVMLENGEELRSRLEVLREDGRAELVEEIEKFIASKDNKPGPRRTLRAKATENSTKESELGDDDGDSRSSSPIVASRRARTRGGLKKATGTGKGKGVLSLSDEVPDRDAEKDDVMMEDGARSITPNTVQQPVPPTSPSEDAPTRKSLLSRMQTSEDNRSRTSKGVNGGNGNAIDDRETAVKGHNGQVLVVDSSSNEKDENEEGSDSSDIDKDPTPRGFDGKGNGRPNSSYNQYSPDRNSPVARVRTPGTPGRIRMMKNRHGDTGPMARTQNDISDEELEGPEAPQELSPEPDETPSRGMSIPRLSQISLVGMRNMASNFFKPKTDTGSRPQTIKVPPSQPDPLSDSSDSDESSSEEDAPQRNPKLQRASSRLAMPPRKSVLSQL
ncbi:hypothetical protein FRC14_003127 [Serendipita sp. 396]|nr:hypothetical protein FRC14_003127 [Serendipita sp. 396]KAG8788110.1 hypothetical protein FRC15_006074 [Serendipita sp. 397]KAG8874795.1 hypothetical protein FRC20_005223 [Serendipita sp. 405]